MAGYGEGTRYHMGQVPPEDQIRPISTYNAHQDEFGFKEGNDYPDAPGGYQKFPPGAGYEDRSLAGPGYAGPGYGGRDFIDPASGAQGYVDPGYGRGSEYVDPGYGGRGEMFHDAPERMPVPDDIGVGGPKSAYGDSSEGAYGTTTAAYDRPTSDQTQFGHEGKDDYGFEGSDPQLGGGGLGGRGVRESSGGDDEGKSEAEERGGKGGMMSKIKEKVKEKMPGHH